MWHSKDGGMINKMAVNQRNEDAANRSSSSYLNNEKSCRQCILMIIRFSWLTLQTSMSEQKLLRNNIIIWQMSHDIGDHLEECTTRSFQINLINSQTKTIFYKMATAHVSMTYIESGRVGQFWPPFAVMG